MSARLIDTMKAIIGGAVFVTWYSLMVAYVATNGEIWQHWFGG